MFVKIKKLHPDAQVPAYATVGAACFDLHSVSDIEMPGPCRPKTFATGLAFDIPTDHVMLVFCLLYTSSLEQAGLPSCRSIVPSHRSIQEVTLSREEVRFLVRRARP